MTQHFPSPKPDYAIVEKKANKENIELASKRLNALSALTPDKLKGALTRRERIKFKGISERHQDMSAHDLIQEAVSSPVAMRYLANDFSKLSRRQGIHEKVAAGYLKERLVAVSSPVITLPKKGVGSILLADSKTVKSLDFMWVLDTPSSRLVGVAAHKYTKEGGGAQDHQCKELQRLVDVASSGSSDCVDTIKQATGATDVMVVAISDGDYYEKGPGKRALDGMKRASGRSEKNAVLAGHIQDIPQAWGRFVAEHVSLDELDPATRQFVEQAVLAG